MREIKLGEKAVALADDCDYDRLSHHRWWLSSHGYAVTDVKGRRVRMHRLVLGAGDGEMVDHINRDRLDNRRENLRVTDRSGNASSRGPNRSRVGQCPFKGVYFNAGKWEAKARVGEKQYYIGRYKTPEAAALAYNIAAMILFKDMACFNPIPGWK